MTQVNLLPWREEAKKARKLRFITLIIIVIILAIIAFAMTSLFYQSLISRQNERNDYLTTVLGQEQGKLNSLNDKKKVLLKFDEALHSVMSLREQSYRVVQLLNTLTRITPEAISFTTVEIKNNNIVLSGRAKSDSQITLLMSNIAKEKIFKQPDLSQIVAKESPTGDERIFQIKVEFQG